MPSWIGEHAGRARPLPEQNCNIRYGGSYTQAIPRQEGALPAFLSAASRQWHGNLQPQVSVYTKFAAEAPQWAGHVWLSTADADAGSNGADTDGPYLLLKADHSSPSFKRQQAL